MLRRFLIASVVASMWSLMAFGPGVSASTVKPGGALVKTVRLGDNPPPGAVITVRRITLSANECAARNAALTAAGLATDATCSGEIRSWSVTRQPLPGSTGLVATRPLSSTVQPYYYWHNWSEACGIACAWKFDLETDGVANDVIAWKWDEWCTPSGIGTSITWCGLSGNGTASIRFGLNGSVFLPPFTYNHGLRYNVDKYGYKCCDSVF
jgi:hypothetical protein